MTNRSPHTTKSASDVREVDAIFRLAGLVRNRRAGQLRSPRPRREGETPEELAPLKPVPLLASTWLPLLQIPAWRKLPWLWHAFTTRKGGVSRVYCAEGEPGELNLGFTASDDRALVEENRRRLAEAVTGDPATQLVTVRQFHSNLLIKSPGHTIQSGYPHKGDGLMTAQAGVLLAIQTADCIPVLVADRKQRVVAAFHAGWRGTVSRIVESGIGKMRLEFNANPKDLVAAIGPGICACCYAIGEEVFSAFESQFSYAGELFHEVYDTDAVRQKYPMLFLTQRAPGHSPIGPSLHLDLIEANRRQLLDAGVPKGAIHVAGGCTNCHPDLFFSHRRSQGHAGRMMSVIGIKPE